MRRLAAVIAVALIVAACDTGEGVDIGGNGDVPEGGTLIAGISSEPDQLDPHLTSAYASFQVLENVYDTLVQPTTDLEFEEALATDWEISDDQLTWTFSLREDVEFHDGSPFTSADVVYSIERIMDEGANSWRFAAVESVTAPDDLTVEFVVSSPTPNLLSNIGAFKGMAIIPEGAADDGAISEPVGTGPFSFVSYSEGTNITLEANPNWWGGDVALDGLEFRFISEGTAALTALRTGEIHWTDNIPPQDVETVLDDGDLEAEAVAGNDYWYVAFNINEEPFDDVRVRQALAFATDRADVTEAAQFDAATPNQTAIPEGSFWHLDYSPFERDVDRAQELLDEAGVDGLTIDLMVTNEFEETIQAAQVLESQWGEIGVDVDIRILDFSAWLDEQGEGNFDAFLLGWLGNIDPDDFYYAQHRTDAGFNFHGYSNPDVDELLDAAREETDEDARKDLYDEAVTIIVDEVSYLYLYNPDIVHAWAPEVSGYEVHPDAAIRFANAGVDG